MHNDDRSPDELEEEGRVPSHVLVLCFGFLFGVLAAISWVWRSL